MPQPRERERDERQAAEKSCYLIYEGVDENGNKLDDGSKIDAFITRLQPKPLNHDKHYPAGDFRSKECIELLKQADIVVTNPPFSLFREYVAQLIEYDKKFVIIGSANAITYKEIFKLIKDNQIWLGYGFKGGNAYFATPNPRDFASGVYDDKTGLVKFRNAVWFTNLPHKKRNEILETIYNYDPQKYPKYDNYDAINVDKTLEIPMDYDGVMGVPITFLDKYNPNQFEIIGQMVTTKIDEFNFGYPYINGKKIYARILIKKIPKKA